MKFNLLMSKEALFKNLTADIDKKSMLIAYGKWLGKKLGRPLKVDDFIVKGRISKDSIYKYFSNIHAFRLECGQKTKLRCQSLSESDLRTFLNDIKEVNSDGCWITNYYVDKYSKVARPKIKYKGNIEYLYRLSYRLFKDEIPKDLMVTHSCDNPICYNPKHLVVGTAAQNSKDASIRKRWPKNKRKAKKSHNLKNIYDFNQIKQFLRENCSKTDKNEWLYIGNWLQNGYPVISFKNKNYFIHRLIVANKVGKKYEKVKYACHRLPDGSKPKKHDLNPDHLYEGNASDNARDTLAYHPNVKLSFEVAKKIRKEAAEKSFKKFGSKIKFDSEWAKKLGVHPTTISAIRRNKAWSIQ